MLLSHNTAATVPASNMFLQLARRPRSYDVSPHACLPAVLHRPVFKVSICIFPSLGRTEVHVRGCCSRSSGFRRWKKPNREKRATILTCILVQHSSKTRASITSYTTVVALVALLHHSTRDDNLATRSAKTRQSKPMMVENSPAFPRFLLNKPSMAMP